MYWREGVLVEELEEEEKDMTGRVGDDDLVLVGFAHAQAEHSRKNGATGSKGDMVGVDRLALVSATL